MRGKEQNIQISGQSAGAKAGEPAVNLLKLDAGASLAILYSEHSNSLE